MNDKSGKIGKKTLTTLKTIQDKSTNYNNLRIISIKKNLCDCKLINYYILSLPFTPRQTII